jgi:hypothetical protein
LAIVNQEGIVKLSKREIALIADFEKSRRRRKIGAWVFLIFVPIWWYGIPLIGIESGTAPVISGLLLGFGVAYLISVYFGVRPDDQLIELLQRYINDDVEAIQQLSGRSEGDGFAA